MNEGEKREIGKQNHFILTKKINTMLLISHVGLLGLFAFLHITFMVYVNVVSISLYLFLFLIYKKSVVRYVFIVYMEVLIHMLLATVCVGWDGGFQLYCFCLIPCVFLCDYLSRTDGGKSMYPVATSAVIVVLFLIARGICVSRPAIYTLDSVQEYSAIFAYNTLVCFAFLILYMFLFGNRILKKEKQLECMAELDELTQLPNRYLMHEWLSESFRASDGDSHAVVAILDIDDFKMLNDTYGHECGDIVLKEIADEIRKLGGEYLHVCRWGGEEFVFVGTGVDACGRMTDILEGLRSTIERKEILFRDQRIHATVTIGIAEVLAADADFQDTLKRADERLYEGKEKGKNCIVGEEK